MSQEPTWIADPAQVDKIMSLYSVNADQEDVFVTLFKHISPLTQQSENRVDLPATPDLLSFSEPLANNSNCVKFCLVCKIKFEVPISTYLYRQHLEKTCLVISRVCKNCGVEFTAEHINHKCNKVTDQEQEDNLFYGLVIDNDQGVNCSSKLEQQKCPQNNPDIGQLEELLLNDDQPKNRLACKPRRSLLLVALIALVSLVSELSIGLSLANSKTQDDISKHDDDNVVPGPTPTPPAPAPEPVISLKPENAQWFISDEINTMDFMLQEPSTPFVKVDFDKSEQKNDNLTQTVLETVSTNKHHEQIENGLFWKFALSDGESTQCDNEGMKMDTVLLYADGQKITKVQMFADNSYLRGITFWTQQGTILALGSSNYPQKIMIDLEPNEVIIGVKGKYDLSFEGVVVEFQFIVQQIDIEEQNQQVQI